MQDVLAKSTKSLTGQAAVTAESVARAVSVYQVSHFVYSTNKTRSSVVHTDLVTAQGGDQLQGLVKLKGPTSAPQSETTGSQAAPAFVLAKSQPMAGSCRVSHVLGNALGEIS